MLRELFLVIDIFERQGVWILTCLDVPVGSERHTVVIKREPKFVTTTLEHQANHPSQFTPAVEWSAVLISK